MRAGRRVAGAWLGVVALLGAACTSGVPLPTQLAGNDLLLPTPITSVNDAPVLCAGGSYAERVTLHGSPTDPALTWIQFHPSGGRRNVVWPAGHRARFTPQLEVLDPSGIVIASEGQVVRGGCPMPPDGEMIEL